MIAETLEVTIVVSMIVLIAYPSAIAIKQFLLERRDRRIRVALRGERRRTRGP